jgi:iron complex transport system ATP-binding protein
MSNAPSPLLEARSCSVALGGAPVVREVGFAVEPGQCVGLLGPNGSGKTTLLRAIGGALPYDGRLALEGREVRDWPKRPLARRVAFVRQAPALSFDLRVADLVALGRAPHKRLLDGRTDADRERVEEALAAVEMEELADRSARALSGGERGRAFLAQALVQEAGLLLLDEPTAHLDIRHQHAFFERVRRLTRTEGRAALLAAHDLERAARYADHLLVLRPDGRLAAAGPPGEVLTPALIAEVFRMDAQVERSPEGPLRIRYHGPAKPTATA